jgi:hydrogenase maturation factor
VGFAISRVNEEDARTSLEFLEKSGMLEAELNDGSTPQAPAAETKA